MKQRWLRGHPQTITIVKKIQEVTGFNFYLIKEAFINYFTGAVLVNATLAYLSIKKVLVENDV